MKSILMTLILLSTVCLGDSVRVWRENGSERTLAAKITHKTMGEKATVTLALKGTGKKVKIAPSRLSQEDQQYVLDWVNHEDRVDFTTTRADFNIKERGYDKTYSLVFTAQHSAEPYTIKIQEKLGGREETVLVPVRGDEFETKCDLKVTKSFTLKVFDVKGALLKTYDLDSLK